MTTSSAEGEAEEVPDMDKETLAHYRRFEAAWAVRKGWNKIEGATEGENDKGEDDKGEDNEGEGDGDEDEDEDEDEDGRMKLDEDEDEVMEEIYRSARACVR